MPGANIGNLVGSAVIHQWRSRAVGDEPHSLAGPGTACSPRNPSRSLEPLKKRLASLLALISAAQLGAVLLPLRAADSASTLFRDPPPAARPQVMWMWMGSNITPAGITRDLEALRDAGFGGTLMFSLADTTTPWPRDILDAPTPEVIAFTEPWWRRVRHAAIESERLGLEFGMSNCPGYSSSGGPWITPEFSMQEVVWSETRVQGGATFSGLVPRPVPDLRGVQKFPVWNPDTGKLEKPEHPVRHTFFHDIAVLALPASGAVDPGQIVDLSGKLTSDGRLEWAAPAGEWIIYRFGHTVMGAMQQPPQWRANGLECDKLSRIAVEFHVGHIVAELRRHLGDQIGRGFDFYHFDSYESGMPGWTPLMREEFIARRGYDPVPFLPTLAKRVIGDADRTAAYKKDFERTVADLFRANYFPVIREKLAAAGIQFSCEPYGGTWKISEVAPHVDRIMAEFWTAAPNFNPFGSVAGTISAAQASGINLIQAEAFTALPQFSQWSETPGSLKAVGDSAYAMGINRFVLHRFVHQPWGDLHKPGVAMGQWGTHFDHTQTWWEPGKAWVAYLTRCQALLQWGKPVPQDAATVTVTSGEPKLAVCRRKDDTTDVFFIANAARAAGSATVRFPVNDRRPELWHPVTGDMRSLPGYQAGADFIDVPLHFEDSESYFVVFRPPAFGRLDSSAAANFPELQPVRSLAQARWNVTFDTQWGGPPSATFPWLIDWKDHADPRIRFYSGTASYSTTFTANAPSGAARVWLDLGVVKDLARVRLNGRDLGVLWTAPWRVEITAALREGENRLEVDVTNTWANRLIGDEHEPPDCEWNEGDRGYGGPLKRYPSWVLHGTPRPSIARHTFTTWNYFTADSPLQSSGLLGPVLLLSSAQTPPFP